MKELYLIYCPEFWAHHTYQKTEEKLLSIISSQEAQLTAQAEKIKRLDTEIKRLKKLKSKPKLRASKLPKKRGNGDSGSPGKRAGSQKRSKNKSLMIDVEEIVRADNIPAGGRFKGYKNFIVQDIAIRKVVTRYRLERWQLPDGRYVKATLPKSVAGNHFGPTLRTYVLHQYHHQNVTQPLLYQQLSEWDIALSKGQLNALLLENKTAFHTEKATILSSGLSVSKSINVDDTGARHRGQNGYCTHIGNELFAWFESTRSKSRINFLQLLQVSATDYRFTRESWVYMKRYNVPPWLINALQARWRVFIDKAAFETHLEKLNITSKTFVRLVTEAALIGIILTHNPLMKAIVVISDDAGQFNVFKHALCWIHAERGITKRLPSYERHAKLIEWARSEIWDIYHLLLDYKLTPTTALKQTIQKRFNTFCKTKTDYQLLNHALKRLYNNKQALLMVLNRPDIPLHNNLSEGDIREYVKRRKISGPTRSEQGRQCRDTFASLKKTARKLGVHFWDYLYDRISFEHKIPPIADLIVPAASP